MYLAAKYKYKRISVPPRDLDKLGLKKIVI